MDSGKGTVFVVGNDSQVSAMWFNEGYSLLRNNIDKADIVCFIGGWDIDPALYGQTKNPQARVQVGTIEDTRDLQAFNSLRPEVLKVGICRGAQFLHVMNGGRLIQHVSGHASTHKIYDTIWKKEVEVTSSHHQMMTADTDAEVFGYAEDVGTEFIGQFGDFARPAFEPEILWHNDTKSLCIQSHPEWEVQKEGGRHFFKLVDMVK